MLSRLVIKNYALIDSLDISFAKGLNIITGETGAGKSIIMGALGLILGNRVEGKPFYSEGRKCIIEGFFGIQSYSLAPFFEENDLDYEEETIIRREISADGKSRAFVNDTPVTLQVLKSLGEKLIDIHSQHATLQINTEEFQLFVLDSLANNQSNLITFRNSLLSYKKSVNRLAETKEEINKAAAELDYNRFIFDELEKFNLKADEQAQLELEQTQLENAEEIKKALLASTYALEDSEINVLFQLKDAISNLNQISNYLPAIGDLTNRLQSATIEIKDIVEELSTIEQDVVLDESRLAEVNERLSELYSLQKKHRLESVEQLVELRDSVEQKILAVSNQEEHVAELEREMNARYELTREIAEVISANRKKIAVQMQEEVEQRLAQVGMTQAKLSIELTKLAKFNQNGIDQVQYLFSANKGQALNPIHKVASGGELSRVMLAIKSLVVKSSALPTIIFDEIDTGVSGEVALKVGDLMEQLAEDMQVIAITHLPQIASKGTSHFKVFKREKGNITETNISLMNSEERIQEIAEMLSGANPGETAVEHAKKLLIN
ncbi:DNA repair protein RecN [Sphingobacterium hungaricum]|uniref:DNA repair protein RecN n=1 Tax=Sphingobacterium hungaricum TaxID=2082723 RepID=A0A928UWJ0_9SPHI|nr:DNA repair protein RecN [Sphingobacterium hungaricum]MBE8714616.1 DNA repair protein RecN [Sphingobacterium hungaricum]